MDDRVDRIVEVFLSVVTTLGAMYGVWKGCFSGQQGVILIIAAIALFQSTSLARIFGVLRGKKLDLGDNNE